MVKLVQQFRQARARVKSILCLILAAGFFAGEWVWEINTEGWASSLSRSAVLFRAGVDMLLVSLVIVCSTVGMRWLVTEGTASRARNPRMVRVALGVCVFGFWLGVVIAVWSMLVIGLAIKSRLS